MGETTISTLVEGGSASAGPPLGPQLGPLPVDIGAVVGSINEKTAAYEGMEVPVDVTVDEDTGDFEIEVGTPPAAALIKEKAGIESGSGEPNSVVVADLDFATVIQVAEMKRPDLNALDLRGAVKEIIGSCDSMGVTIDGQDPRDVHKQIDDGAYDDALSEAEN